MSDDTDTGATDEREMGVDFGDLRGDLEDEEYPLSQGALLDRYGDRELEISSGTRTVREVLSDLGERDYESVDDVRQAVLNMVGEEAVGREGYSDRGGDGQGRESDQESF